MARFKRQSTVSSERTREVMKVALGEAEADLAIVNGNVLSVYTGEILTGLTVLIKGDKIAYVGNNASRSIGASTEVIDANGKVLIPGLIDGHTHILGSVYSASELIKYAIKGGTTTIITETSEIAFLLGYQGIVQFLRSVKNQPMKIFITAPPMLTISPIAKEHALQVSELRKLLKRKEVLGLGESYWGPIVEGDPKLLDLIAETEEVGKKVEGHSAGARGNKLQAYASLGISSCHEPTTAEEVLERLRLGMFVLIREGQIRRDLENVSRIKDENIDFSRLALVTDGVGSWELTTDGHMDFVDQKAIKLGFNPILAIQMATINIAQHFAIDDIIGGIAPGKYADIVIIPDLETIRPEYVISNGRVVAKNGQLLVEPRRQTYPKSTRNTIHLTRDFDAHDFAVPVESGRRQVKVRVIDLITDLLTREAILSLPVSNGLAQPDISKDVIKIAAIERTHQPGKTFVGFIRGIGLKHGAVATSTGWDSCDMVVVGASEADMAQAVNRIRELNGDIVVCAGGKILAETPLPIGGIISPEPIETISRQLRNVQQAAADLGCVTADILNTLGFLTSGGIPFWRICEQGLVDVRQNKFVDLIVD